MAATASANEPNAPGSPTYCPMRASAPVSRRGPTSLSTSFDSRRPSCGGNMPACERSGSMARANAAAPASPRPINPPMDVPTHASVAGRSRATRVAMSDTYCGTV